MHSEVRPKHGFVMMKVNVSAPVSLFEWLYRNASGRWVRDVILRGKGEYDLPAVILDNGFLLPVSKTLDVATANPNGEVNESLIGWWVSDLLYMRGENQEGLAVELLPASAVWMRIFFTIPGMLCNVCGVEPALWRDKPCRDAQGQYCRLPLRQKQQEREKRIGGLDNSPS